LKGAWHVSGCAARRTDVAGFGHNQRVDFLRIVRSLEDLLYEIIAWLVFYPRTLARILVHPREMLQYSDVELIEAHEAQYDATLSPPLFLMLTVLIAHAIELAAGEAVGQPKGTVGQMLYGSEQNLLLTRSVQFSIYALTGATTLLRRRRLRLDRRSLRGPFYAQCYLAAPFGLFLSGATVMARLSSTWWTLAALVLALGAIAWYLGTLADWFRRHLSVSPARAVGIALWCFVQAAVCNAVINTLVRGSNV
jgi:hypothetical protein